MLCIRLVLDDIRRHARDVYLDVPGSKWRPYINVLGHTLKCNQPRLNVYSQLFQ